MMKMLNIHSKKEVQEAIKKNQNRFKDAKETILENSFKRDKKIVRNTITARLRHEIALSYYFKLEHFKFSLPLIDFNGYDLMEEEKQKILDEYYQSNLVSRLFAKHFSSNIFPKECEINHETNEAHFMLRLKHNNKKEKVQKETDAFLAILDEYVYPHLSFEHISKEISNCYETLSSDHILALYEEDLERYPILSLDFDEILTNTDFYSRIHLPNSDLKLDISHYAHDSQLFKSLKQTLEEHGYDLDGSSSYSDEQRFRYHQLSITLNVNGVSKELEKEKTIKSEVLRELFNQKKKQYDELLEEKAKKENPQLIQLVKDGYFDELVASTWLKATLMSTQKTIERHFKGERIGEMELQFIVPFDRNLPIKDTFKRSYHVNDGLGKRYRQLDYHVLHALKERYTFLNEAELEHYTFCDYQQREGVFPTEDFRLFENTLTFDFKIDHIVYRTFKQEILEFLGHYYGTLDVLEFFNKIEFHEEGISKKIEAYIEEHSKGEASVNDSFKLILGKIDVNEMFILYQESNLYDHTEELFENTHEDEAWSYWRFNDEYKEARLKELQTLKLANLFTQALLVHPTFKEMKKALKEFDYDLKIEFLEENKKTMETGDKSLSDTPLSRVVCEYTVQLSIE